MGGLTGEKHGNVPIRQMLFPQVIFFSCQGFLSYLFCTPRAYRVQPPIVVEGTIRSGSLFKNVLMNVLTCQLTSGAPISISSTKSERWGCGAKAA